MDAVIEKTLSPLADLRHRAGKTTRQTAVALGVTQPRITQIEQEGTKDIEQLEKLAEFFGADFESVRQANTQTRYPLENK